MGIGRFGDIDYTSRRFGKTLNMSMLEYFFSNKHANRGDLFEGLDIWKEEKYRNLQGTYPVLFLSFAGVKHTDYKNTRETLNHLILNLFKPYEWLGKGIKKLKLNLKRF